MEPNVFAMSAMSEADASRKIDELAAEVLGKIQAGKVTQEQVASMCQKAKEKLLGFLTEADRRNITLKMLACEKALATGNARCHIV